jgi:hypothetical protein
MDAEFLFLAVHLIGFLAGKNIFRVFRVWECVFQCFDVFSFVTSLCLDRVFCVGECVFCDWIVSEIKAEG